MSERIQTDGSFSTDVYSDVELEMPPNFNVIFFNDDYTTMDFVVNVLKSVFHKSDFEAEKLMNSVHTKGSAIVGTYTYDIAATRVTITRNLARKEGFPLRVEMENA
ncbi:MAG: ATP-dependent Clp protease adaptor ClpS [Treponema sp.]|jgi:ATP-dependent Clp protease adaptor protein ClpS|nr:ATP-dependent Clp protease adaptor ClpS [Treponema sp.]